MVDRTQLRDTAPNEFEGGEDEQSRVLKETEHDSAALGLRWG